MTPGKNLLHPLTALRFFAALFIVLHHARPVFGDQFAPTCVPLDQGVSFFFVLSGFILAYNYPVLKSRESIFMFYAARFARVWPVHIVTAIVALLTSPWPAPSHLIPNVLLLQAWIPYKDFFFTLNAVSWSLSAETFFYLSFPLLIWRWKEYWHWKVLIALLAAVSMICLGNYFHLPSWENTTDSNIGLDALSYINPLVRVFEFVLGICTASVYRYLSQFDIGWSRAQATLLEIAAVLLTILTLRFCLFLSDVQWIGHAGIVYMTHQGGLFACAMLILVFAFERGWISRLLSLPIAVRLGEISFSMYMIHMIVLDRFEPFTKLLQGHLVVMFFCYLAACLVISYSTFIAIEQPMRLIFLSFAKRYIHTDGKWSFPSISTLVKPIAFGTAIALGFFLTEVLAKPYIRMRDLVAMQKNDQLPQATIAHATFNGTLEMEEFHICLVDPNTAELSYVLQPQAQVKLQNVQMAVHLLGSSRVIAGVLDHNIDNGAPTLEASSRWRRNVRFPSAKLQGIDEIGFSMYTDVKNLYPIDGAANTDWGSRRLIFPVPQNWQHNCAN